MNSLFEQYLKDAQDKGSLKYVKNRPLSAVSTFGIGGNAAFFVVPSNIPSAKEVLRVLYELKERYLVIGNASNLLFSDCGFDGTVISTKSLCHISDENGVLAAECGVMLPRLSAYCAEKGYTGFEGLCSIPATVGGAIRMNAGAFGCEISDRLISVSVYSPESDKTVIKSVKECDFSYRHSAVANKNEIILEARFLPKTGKTADILEKIDINREKRANSQPTGVKSAGSYFKKPDSEKSAGELIELCGLKGKRIGGAAVSEKHGNFIINEKSARAKDVLALAKLIKESVFRKTGVLLSEEVLYIE